MEDETESKPRPWLWFLSAAVFVVAVLGAVWYSLGADAANRGTFGDMFGVANALFTGLAFAGVIVTIALQSKELKLQRDELTATRKEVAGQKAALEGQLDLSRNQAFHVQFFELLRAARDAREAITDSGTRVFNKERSSWEVKGSRAIRSHRQTMHHVVTQAIDASSTQPGKTDPRALDLRSFSEEYVVNYIHHYAPDMGTYFATLAALFGLLDSAPRKESRRALGELLVGQMSPPERVLAFYLAVSARYETAWGPVVQRWPILLDTTTEELMHPDHDPALNRYQSIETGLA